MDISEANIEAYVIYRKAHNDLNVTIKVALGALEEIKMNVSNDASGKLLGLMVDKLGMPWGKGKTFPRSPEIINTAIENYTYNSVVQALGNFEYFLTHLVTDLAHFSDLNKANKAFDHAHIAGYVVKSPPTFPLCCFSYAEQLNRNHHLIPRIDKIKNDISLVSKELDKLLPLFQYFWLLRNCIVHLEGMANKDLCDFYITKELIDSFDYWNLNYSRMKSPLLPIPIRGQLIKIDATCPIMSSAVCFELAKIFNQRAIEVLDKKGLIHMATYYGLIQLDHEFRNERSSNSAEGVISNYLSNRYHVLNVNTLDLIQDLKNLNLRELSLEMYKNYSNKCT